MYGNHVLAAMAEQKRTALATQVAMARSDQSSLSGRRDRSAHGVDGFGDVEFVGGPIAHRDANDVASGPARTRHPGGTFGEQVLRDRPSALIATDGQADLGVVDPVQYLRVLDRAYRGGDRLGVAHETIDEISDAGASQRLKRRPHRHAASPTRHLRDFLERITGAVGDEVARVHSER